MLWNVGNHLNVLSSSDMMEDLQNDGYNAEEIDLNQLQQQSAGSAHSSDSNKDIVKEANELRVRNTSSFIIAVIVEMLFNLFLSLGFICCK